MRINGTGNSQKVGQRSETKKKLGAGQSFTLSGEVKTNTAAQTAAAAAPTSMDALLALQSVDDATVGRRKAARHGHSLLDALDDLKADLLAGQISQEKLNRLLKLVQQAKSQSDPQLDALVADIELRARVELAKLGYFPQV